MVDRARCCGYGNCVVICPELLSLDDGGQARVVISPVPEELIAQARECVEGCPQSAIALRPLP
ncbi:MAG: ferredoxin [Gammaproteobacteria bacterium]|nr:ferredoxin [Gammaproteobacteria bacterium]